MRNARTLRWLVAGLVVLTAGRLVHAGEEKKEEAAARKGLVRLLRKFPCKEKWYVRQVAITPDARYVAAVAEYKSDGTLFLWDAETGKKAIEVSVERYVRTLTLSPGARRIMLTYRDEARLLDGDTGKTLLRFGGSPGAVLSPDGRFLAYVPYRRPEEGKPEIRLYDFLTWKDGPVLTGHEKSVSRLGWSHGGRFLIAVTDLENICVWDVKKGVLRTRMAIGKRGSVPSLGASRDGSRVAARVVVARVRGRDTEDVYLWNGATGKPVQLEQFGRPRDMVLTPDGRHLIATQSTSGSRLYGGREIKTPRTGYLVVIDTRNGKVLHKTKHEGMRIVPVAVAVCGRRLVTGGMGEVHLWAFEPKPAPAAVKPPTTGPVGEAPPLQLLRTLAFKETNVHFRAVAVSPDGQRVAAISSKKLFLAETKEKGQRLELPLRDSGWSLEFSPDGKLLAVGMQSTVALVDAVRGRALREIEDENDAAFSPDGRFLAYHPPASGDLHVWEPATGREVLRLRGKRRNVQDLAWSGDGRLLAELTGFSRLVTLWNMERGTKAGKLELPEDDIIRHFFLSADGRHGLSDGRGRTRLWNMEKGKEIPLSIQRRGRRQEEIGVLPCGTDQVLLARGGWLHALHASDGRLAWRLPFRNRPVSLDVSPDGRYLVTTYGGTVRLWALEWPKELQERIAKLEAEAKKLKDAGKAAEAKKLLDEAAALKAKLEKMKPSEPPAGGGGAEDKVGEY